MRSGWRSRRLRSRAPEVVLDAAPVREDGGRSPNVGLGSDPAGCRSRLVPSRTSVNGPMNFPRNGRRKLPTWFRIVSDIRWRQPLAACRGAWAAHLVITDG